MEEEIKITAHLEPNRPEALKLIVDRPLYPQGSAHFPDIEKAKASPLAEKIFQVKNIASVRITGSELTLTKRGPEEWRPVAGNVAQIIREHLRSGNPAVNPDYRPSTLSDEALRIKVQEIFETQINPAVAAHGGQVELIDVKEGKVYLRLGGGCQGCGMADVTLRQGIESTLREQVPELVEILDATDHASGANPYYTPSEK